LTKNLRRRFYNKLRKTKNHFRWRLTLGGQIRGFKKNDKNLHSFCPITAISFVETGKVRPSWDADQLDVELGIPLTVEDRNVIMWAADGRKTNKEEIVIAQTMKRILGLKD
jgi:hypothetical protein